MNYQYWQEISFYLDELDKERTNFEQNSDSAEVMDATRKNMAALLDNMRAGLEKQLDKHHTSLIMFAIVAAVDEKMQSYHYNASKVRWVPLQKDFYSAYTAGEVFYKSVDEILDDPNTPNIVYQVYYSMLKRGFQGKYADSKTQINKYLEMLKDKIPVSSTGMKTEVPSNAFQQKKRRLKKWHCYGLSACVFLVIFGVLFVTSNL